MAITVTPQELAKSFQTYRKDLLMVPFLAMKELLQHTNVRTGIRYKEHVGKIGGDFQFGNYKKDKKGNGDATITGRTFETFFGNLVEPIDPNALYESIYGSNITKGNALKNVPIVKQMATYVVRKVWENVLVNTFTAKHDGTNFTDTSKWFNGFASIIEADITAGNVSEAKGNLQIGTASIDKTNAEDIIKDFFWSRDAKLRRQKTKLFMNDATYHAYTEAYQLNHGSLPYNQNYDKRTLEGASNVEIVPLSFVPEDFLLLTPKSNIFALFNQRSDDEKYIVADSKDNHYDVDIVANAFFGTQFEMVDKEMLSVWKK